MSTKSTSPKSLGGNKLIDLGAGVGATDAVNLGQLQDTVDARASNIALTPVRPRKTLLHTFQAGSTAPWITQMTGGGVAIKDDTTTYAIGSQSFAVSPGSSTVNDTLYRYDLPPVDMTGKDFSVLLKVDNVDNLGTMTWKTPTGSGSAGSPTLNLIPTPLLESGKWVWVTLPFTNTASANRANVTGFEMTFKRSALNLPVKVNIQAIASTPTPNPFPKGALSIDLDDGYGEHYSRILPILSKYDFRATVYPVVEQIKTGTNAMTVSQLQELQNAHGWLVGAHADTWAHHNQKLSLQTPDELKASVRANRDWLLDNGLRGGAFFAYPQGFVDQTNAAIARQYFAWARSAGFRPYENLPANDFVKVRCYPMSYSTGAQAAAKKLIDDAIATRTHLVMLFHNFSTAGDSTHYSVADFAYLIDYAAASGIYVGTAADILAELRAPSSSVYTVDPIVAPAPAQTTPTSPPPASTTAGTFDPTFTSTF